MSKFFRRLLPAFIALVIGFAAKDAFAQGATDFPLLKLQSGPGGTQTMSLTLQTLILMTALTLLPHSSAAVHVRAITLVLPQLLVTASAKLILALLQASVAVATPVALVLVSAGHSNATYQEAIAAFDRGIPAATHLFNAMSPFQHRAPGMAIFLTSDPDVAPVALMHNLKHNKVLHEHNLFVTVRHHEVPWIGFDKRVDVESLDNDCWQVTLHFGFKNEPDVPEALELLKKHGVQLEEMETSYFLSRDIVIPTSAGGISGWLT